MGRIKQITDSANQKGRKLLIPYLVAGDPNKETTIELMHALVSNGAEIGRASCRERVCGSV